MKTSRFALSSLLTLVPAAAAAHVGFVLGGGGGFRGLFALVWMTLGVYGALLILSIVSFFVASRTLFYITVSLDGLGVAGGLFIIAAFGGFGPVVIAPLGAAIVSLTLSLFGRRRHRRKASLAAGTP